MTVFTNGCFDLLHRGHVSLLRFCRELAGNGKVIVALNSDVSVSRLKGPSRPIMSSPERSAAIYLTNLVDHVIVFDEDEPTELVERLRPDILVKGDQYRGTEIPGSIFAGSVMFAPMVPGISTTSIIAELQCH